MSDVFSRHSCTNKQRGTIEKDFAHQSDSGVRIRCSIMACPLIPFAPVTKATLEGEPTTLMPPMLFCLTELQLSN